MNLSCFLAASNILRGLYGGLVVGFLDRVVVEGELTVALGQGTVSPL